MKKILCGTTCNVSDNIHHCIIIKKNIYFVPPVNDGVATWYDAGVRPAELLASILTSYHDRGVRLMIVYESVCRDMVTNSENFLAFSLR